MSRSKTVVDANGIAYELGELLGRGGQGAVYRVKGGRVAVKLVSGTGQRDRERMRNRLTHVRRLPVEELRLARPIELLRPPHVGYVMELLTGMAPIKTLMGPPKGEQPGVEWYTRSGGLRRRLLVLARAAHILAQLHGKGLAYSDPSPDNIFISEDPTRAEVRFIDSDNLCYQSSPSGKGGIFTPGYGAPELVQGRSGVTTLTDAHAFAVIAFQVLVLAHPFIGDSVDAGEPELEEKALAGHLPWIDDASDDRNRASFGVAREWVLSNRLRGMFEQTFGPGRATPEERPSAASWAERLFAAADATLHCASCGGTFYLNAKRCVWCDAARPTFATAALHLWDPGLGPKGRVLTEPRGGQDRPIVVGQCAVGPKAPLLITRRLAFDEQGLGAETPVIEASLSGDRLSIQSLDRQSYPLCSATGHQETVVSERPQAIPLVRGQASWSLHLGEMTRLHRVLSFALRPGGDS